MLLGEQLASKPSAWGSNPHPGAKGERGRWQVELTGDRYLQRFRQDVIHRLDGAAEAGGLLAGDWLAG
jgi:hypothetical protein